MTKSTRLRTFEMQDIMEEDVNCNTSSTGRATQPQMTHGSTTVTSMLQNSSRSFTRPNPLDFPHLPTLPSIRRTTTLPSSHLHFHNSENVRYYDPRTTPCPPSSYISSLTRHDPFAHSQHPHHCLHSLGHPRLRPPHSISASPVETHHCRYRQ